MDTSNTQHDLALARTARAHQDALIGKRLPQWLRTATADQLPDVGQAMRLSLYYRHRVNEVLARIQGIDGFAIPRLERAFRARFSTAIQAKRWSFRWGHWEGIPVLGSMPVGASLAEVRYVQMPLLEAALRNFAASEVSSEVPVNTVLWPSIERVLGEVATHDSVGEVALKPIETVLGKVFARGVKVDYLALDNGLISPDGHRQASPTATEFAKLCRALDLGGQYQQHLDDILRPSTAQAPEALPVHLIAQSQRYAMLVDAHVALHSARVTAQEHQLLVRLCLMREPLSLDGATARAMQLKLLGCALEQIVVLKLVEQGLLHDTTRRVLVYVPGDEQGAWRSYADLRHFANDLGRRLRIPAYQRFFARFVRRRDSQRFFSAVSETYEGLSDLANGDLQERLVAYPGELFDSLGQARIEQIKDDAKTIAMPVAELDRRVQREHEQRLVAEGWALLNLAGFFVPALGVVLLATTAWNVLGEIFHGIEAWKEGDTSEALDHLIEVATDLATLGATALGVGLASRLWSRSAVVDGLSLAYLEDGRTKLVSQDLTVFRGTPAPEAVRDEQGIYRLGERTWVEIDGEHYPVRQRLSDRQWQLEPRNEHGPLLQHNGAGAWRVWWEQPGTWENRHYLFRRLGGDLRELSDVQIDQVLSFHGLDEDYLRGLHVHGLAPDAELLDSAVRCRLAWRIRELVAGLRAGVPSDDIVVLQGAQHLPGARGLADQALAGLAWRERRTLLRRLYEGMQPSDNQATATLRRAFPSLTQRGAERLVREASAMDRRRLSRDGRVCLRLGEAARASVLRMRMARVYEALELDTPQNADLARVVLGLLRYLPRVASGIRWRLFEGALDGPLLSSVGEGHRAFDLLHLDGRFVLLDERGQALNDPGELFEVLTPAFETDQRESLGSTFPFADHLRERVSRQALQRRQEVERLLHASAGPMRLPQRLSDGRVGYRLTGCFRSGRRSRSAPLALPARVRQLYPTLTDEQVSFWLGSLERAQVDVEHTLTRLERECRMLRQVTSRWVTAAEGEEQEEEREMFYAALLQCWQRRTLDRSVDVMSGRDFWWGLNGVTPGSLPELPSEVSFAHVSRLELRAMALEHVPESFLQAFPNLDTLVFSGSRLSRVPAYLTQMRRLRHLDLFGNQIVLDPGQSAILASCEGLVYLNLSFNPLGRSFSIQAMADLTELRLRSTGLGTVPYGLMDRPRLHTLDLGNNWISQLPEAFFESRIWRQGIVQMDLNPLDEAAQSSLQASREALPVGTEVATAARVRWMDTVSPQLRDEFGTLWALMEIEMSPGDFLVLLEQLLNTAEFQSRAGARNLADRVYAMLVAMEKSPDLRDELFRNAEAITCQDSVAMRFSDLETQVLIWQAQQGGDRGGAANALLRLGQRLWRLDEVDRLALEDIVARRDTGSDPDEIEVMLAYRLALRDDLDLPINTQAMMFEAVADVEASRIEQARARIREGETEERLAHSLIQRTFWRQYLQHAHASRFDAFNAPYHERLEALLEPRHELAERDALDEIAHIQTERESGERVLMLELTLAALDDAARGEAGSS